ncbi:MAG: hypothetical protein U0521_15435 [Anaerolineae bacterium]
MRSWAGATPPGTGKAGGLRQSSPAARVDAEELDGVRDKLGDALGRFPLDFGSKAP